MFQHFKDFQIYKVLQDSATEKIFQNVRRSQLFWIKKTDKDSDQLESFLPPNTYLIHIPYSILIKNWWKSSLELPSTPIHIPYSILIQNWWKSSLELPSSPIHIPYSILIQNWWKSSLELPSLPIHIPYSILIQNWWKSYLYIYIYIYI